MGSHRWTSFAHRLSKKHRVVVVKHGNLEEQPIFTELRNGIEVITIDNECTYVKAGKKRASAAASKQQRELVPTEIIRRKTTLKGMLRGTAYVLSMRQSAKQNASRILGVLSSISFSPDCIISTSRPFIDSFLGYYLAKNWHTPWLLDQRDLQYNDGDDAFTVKLYTSLFRRMDSLVSMYTLVSHGMGASFAHDCHLTEELPKRVRILTNGYAREYMTAVPRTGNNALVITYTGDLYTGRRDATILFDAIDRLLQRSPSFLPSDFQIQYAGTEGFVLREQAKEFSLADIVVDNGTVPYEQAIKMLQAADIQLLLTWNTEMDQGIIPGKLYEYMMTERPIVCITCGSKPDGEAAGMVNQMNLGIAVDSINYEQDVKRLADYLELQLTRKHNGMPLLYEPNTTAVKEYDYDTLTEKLEQFLMEITQ